MDDFFLQPITALGAVEPRIDRLEGITVTEIASRSLASLASRRGHDEEFSSCARSVLGFALPGVAAVAHGRDYTACWTGPGQWLVDAPIESHENLAGMLAAGFGNTASITEQTGAWARFDLDGTLAPEIFERLCAVDIRAMAADRITRTAMEHMGVFVICRVRLERFSVLGARSSAKSLHHALVTAAHSAAPALD